MAPQKKPQPLARSLKLIEEERVNVARRTRERIALLFPDTEYGLDLHIATTTTTKIPMGEVHGCLNLFCFCLLLLCLNLLFFQWLYLSKV